LLTGYEPTPEDDVAVVEQVSAPVTLDASDEGVYEIDDELGGRFVRSGVEPYVPVAFTVTVSSDVIMMLPLLPVAMKHAVAEHAAPSTAVMVVGPALRAVVGPLIGLPSWYQVLPPLLVAMTVPIAPPAKQSFASAHATELSASGACDTCCVHVAPWLVELRIAAVVDPVGMVPTA
jgi:hypothetical protein